MIAERMGVSVNTVVYHRRALYATLGLKDREGLHALLGLQSTRAKARPPLQA